MPTYDSIRPPCPASWSEFESLCSAVVERRYRPVNPVQRFGRSGQAQSGVDILYTEHSEHHGFQCKRVTSLKLATVEAELSKAEKFDPDLTTFTILSTAPLDSTLQQQLLKLNSNCAQNGTLEVEVVFWDTLCDWLAANPDLLQRFYPQFFPGMPALATAIRSKLANELPGLDVKYSEDSDGNGTTVIQAGPGCDHDILTLTMKDDTGSITQQWKSVQLHGGELELPSENVDIRLAPALEEALAARLGTSSGLRSVRLRSSHEGSTQSVRVVLRSLSQDRDPETFRRRSRQHVVRGTARSATLTIRKFGSETQEFEVSLDDIPVRLTLNTGGPATFAMNVPDGTPIATYLEADKFLKVLSGGSRLSVWPAGSPEKRPIIASEIPPSPGPVVSDGEIAVLADLALLAELADWDITFPLTGLTQTALAAIPRLLGLFQTGFRQLDSASMEVVLDTPTGLQSFIDSLLSQTPNSLSTELPSYKYELGQQSFTVPARTLTGHNVIVESSHSVEELRQAKLPLETTLQVSPASTDSWLHECLPDGACS